MGKGARINNLQHIRKRKNEKVRCEICKRYTKGKTGKRCSHCYDIVDKKVIKLKYQLNRIEELLENTPINIGTYDFYDRLLEMHKKIWDLLYFKKHQEKDYLKKLK